MVHFSSLAETHPHLQIGIVYLGFRADRLIFKTEHRGCARWQDRILLGSFR